MKRGIAAVVFIGLTLAAVAFAADYNRNPAPLFAGADQACGTTLGATCYITDCLTPACTVGGGSMAQMMVRSAAGWVPENESIGGVNVNAIFCGDLPNSTTNFFSPITSYSGGNFYTVGLVASDLSYVLGGTGCDAEDSTTEATADEIMFPGQAFKALGMYCEVDSSGSNGVIFHLRSAAAATTPDVTCTIATGLKSCIAAIPTTTDIAANATVAINAISTENLSASNAWCILNGILH